MNGQQQSRPKTPHQIRQEARRVNELRASIVEKVNNKSSHLQKVFLMFDKDNSGTIEYREFRKGLEYLGFRLGEDDFNKFCSEIDKDGNGYIDFEEFATYLKMPGGQGARVEHLDDWDELRNQRRKQVGGSNDQAQSHLSFSPGPISNIFNDPDAAPVAPRYSAETAEQVRKRIEEKNLRRAIKDKVMAKSHQIDKVFSMLDTDRSGMLDYSELKSGLERLGCALSLDDFRWFIKQLDPENTGEVSMEQFAAYVNEPELEVVRSGGQDEGSTITGRRIKRSTALQSSHLGLDMGWGGDNDASTRRSSGAPGTPGRAQSPHQRGTNKDIDRLRKRLLDKLYGKTRDLTTIFRSFDEDKNGSVSYPEFQRGLHHLGLTDFTPHEFKLLCTIVDKDGDGEIDYNEFTDLIKTLESPFGREFQDVAESISTPRMAKRASQIFREEEAARKNSDQKAAGMRSNYKDVYNRSRKDTTDSYSYHPTGTSNNGDRRDSVDTMQPAGKSSGLGNKGDAVGYKYRDFV